MLGVKSPWPGTKQGLSQSNKGNKFNNLNNTAAFWPPVGIKMKWAALHLGTPGMGSSRCTSALSLGRHPG